MAERKLFVKAVPHCDEDCRMDIGDISLVLRVYIGEMNGTVASAIVSNSLLDAWKISKKEAFDEAWKNASPKVKKLHEMLSEVIGMEVPDEGTNCYVVTNDRGINGAASIFNPDVADALCELLDDDIVILPTSLHEVMVHPKKEFPVEQLKAILVSTIDEATATGDFLTKSVYEYDRTTKQFRIAA